MLKQDKWSLNIKDSYLLDNYSTWSDVMKHKQRS